MRKLYRVSWVLFIIFQFVVTGIGNVCLADTVSHNRHASKEISKFSAVSTMDNMAEALEEAGEKDEDDLAAGLVHDLIPGIIHLIWPGQNIAGLINRFADQQHALSSPLFILYRNIRI